MLLGPTTYQLEFDTTKVLKVSGPGGGKTFRGSAAQRIPKLYVLAVKSNPVYVGVARQPMGNRLRYGFSAKGKHGYHGYAWRRGLSSG